MLIIVIVVIIMIMNAAKVKVWARAVPAQHSILVKHSTVLTQERQRPGLTCNAIVALLVIIVIVIVIIINIIFIVVVNIIIIIIIIITTLERLISKYIVPLVFIITNISVVAFIKIAEKTYFQKSSIFYFKFLASSFQQRNRNYLGRNWKKVQS